MFIRGGSAPRSIPLPFYIPFFSKKVPLDVYIIDEDDFINMHTNAPAVLVFNYNYCFNKRKLTLRYKVALRWKKILSAPVVPQIQVSPSNKHPSFQPKFEINARALIQGNTLFLKYHQTQGGGRGGGGILIRMGALIGRRAHLRAFTVSLTFSRCWLSLIFRVRPEAGKKKMDFQNVFFFFARQVQQRSVTVEMVGCVYYGKAKHPCQIIQGGSFVPE